MAAVHIVVMFTDLVGSTELSSRLDTTQADALRRAHFAVLRRAVTEHEGVEVKNLGDGLMAVFPGASAALAAAVAVQQGIDAHNRSAPEPLQVRIGISAGEAVGEDGDYFGDPVVEAARLSAAANGGQILAADLVRASAGRRATQTFTALGALPLKGLPDPLATVEVHWEPPAPEAMIPLPARLDTQPVLAFVGRRAELALLGQAFKAASAGEGRRVVLLAGEPGMGKTTLSTEFARTVHAQGGTVLYGRSDEELGLPYQPFVEALGHWVAHAPMEMLRAHVADHGADLGALVPELRRRLGDLAPATSADPDTQRYRLFAAVAGLLAAASACAPVAVVLDDLHWADKPTLLLLRSLVGAALPARLLLIATYRDSELTKGHPLMDTVAALHRETGVERVALTGLGDVDVVALMESGAGHELSESFVDLASALRRETDGNPFFVVQLLRHLAERGWLHQDETGEWRARGELADLSLPETVRDVVGQRVARLGDQADHLLSVAAVVGRDFDVDVLAPVAAVPEPEMVDALDRAVSAGLLSDVGPGRYSFAHAVVQHAVYGGLTATRRSLLHRQVAEALEALYGQGPGPRVGELARHWVAAARPPDVTRAVDYARWAGDAALSALAPEEAVRWFSQALHLAAQERTPDEHLRTELLIDLGTAQRRAGDPAFRETLLTAAHVADSLGDKERLIRAALANSRGTFTSGGLVDQEKVGVLEAALAAGSGDSAERAQLLATLAVELTFAGDWPHRRSLADEALAMARRLGHTATLQRVVGLLYFCVLVPETLDERLAMTAEALASAEGETDPFALHWVHRWRLYACAETGDIDAVDALLPEVIRHGQATRDPYTVWTLTMDQCWRSLVDGRLDETETATVEALRIGTGSDQPEAPLAYFLQLLEIRRQQGRLSEVEIVLTDAAEQYPGFPVLRALLAGLYCELGKSEQAADLLHIDAVDGFAALLHDFGSSYELTIYAEVCAALAQREPARALYDRLAPWPRQLALLPCVVNGGAVALYLAILATVLDRFDDAEAHFAEAKEIHERMRAPYWIARTQLEHARMLLARGGPADSSRAVALLDQVESTAAEYGFAALTKHAGRFRRSGDFPNA